MYHHIDQTRPGSRRLASTIAIGAAALLATACAGGTDEETAEGTTEDPQAETREWLAQECPTTLVNYEMAGDDGEPNGEEFGQALVQGPIMPPEGIDESSLVAGVYTYDALDDALVFERPSEESDVFCLGSDEPEEQPGEGTDFKGQEAEESTSTTLIYLREPVTGDEYWVDATNLDGVYVEHNCTGDWQVATDYAELDDPAEELDHTDEYGEPGFMHGSCDQAD